MTFEVVGEYDVVIDTLQQKYNKLFEMNDRNSNAEFGFGVMDDIRADQMSELQVAIKMWREHK